MVRRNDRSVILPGLVGFVLGGLVVGGIAIAIDSGEDTLSAPPGEGMPAGSPSISQSAPTPSSTRVSSAEPPPQRPSPPPVPPSIGPTGPRGPTGPTPFPCTVTLLPGPAQEKPSVQLVVEAPPDVATAWGVIVSGSDRTGGPIVLSGGRGEQVVSGFDVKSSEVIIYADPSLNPAFEACRSNP